MIANKYTVSIHVFFKGDSVDILMLCKIKHDPIIWYCYFFMVNSYIFSEKVPYSEGLIPEKNPYVICLIFSDKVYVILFESPFTLFV